MDASDLRFRPHSVLSRVVLVDLWLTCRTGLHIGAGKSADLAGSDLPVMRNADEQPFIPGSSLRGVLRAGIEALVESLGLDLARQLAAPAANPSPAESAWEDWKLSERLFGCVAARKGGVSYGSRVQISDLTHEDRENVVEIELRDGVAISRETRTASDNAKFDLEVVPAGTRFRGRVRFKNPADFEIGLVAQALWMLDQGLLLLGGKSARGLGWMEVKVGAPVELSAADLLGGKAVPPAGKPGSVEANFAPYLRGLVALRDAAAALPTVAQREAD